MSVLVLDAGALIALERDNRHIWRLVEATYDDGDSAQAPAGAPAQVYKGQPTQARLNQALKRCKTVPLDEDTAHIAGRLRRISYCWCSAGETGNQCAQSCEPDCVHSEPARSGSPGLSSLWRTGGRV